MRKLTNKCESLPRMWDWWTIKCLSTLLLILSLSASAICRFKVDEIMIFNKRLLFDIKSCERPVLASIARKCLFFSGCDAERRFSFLMIEIKNKKLIIIIILNEGLKRYAKKFHIYAHFITMPRHNRCQLLLKMKWNYAEVMSAHVNFR